MRKQHFTTQVANLINPPLLSKHERLQQEMFEKIYSSNKASLGRTPSPTIPPEAIKQRFGIITEKGDMAGSLLYPYNCRIFCSIYNDSFKPPNVINYSDVPPAGVKVGRIDESGTQMRKVFEETGNEEATKIAPLTTLQKKNLICNMIDEKRPSFDFVDSKISINCLSSSNQPEISLHREDFSLALWNLVKNKKSCYRKHFYSYLKSYLQIQEVLVTQNM